MTDRHRRGRRSNADQGDLVRPSTILSLVSAAVFAVGSTVFAVVAFVAHKDADQGVKWHFWLAPILMLGIVACIIQVVGMYWMQVGRKEVRGRRPPNA
jgi:ABC-type branched-subunit amino acid transport system permease subunit